MSSSGICEQGYWKVTAFLVTQGLLRRGSLTCAFFWRLTTGGVLLGRTLASLFTMSLATSMAARTGTASMAAHQICIQVSLWPNPDISLYLRKSVSFAVRAFLVVV